VANSYCEFFVTQGSAVDDTNGGGPNLGTNDGPIYTPTDVDSDATGLLLTDNAGTPWDGCAVDDWICYDTADAKVFRRITDITLAVATIDQAVDINETEKTVNVGGAWATVAGAAANITAITPTYLTNSTPDPARLNVKYESGVAYPTNDVLISTIFTSRNPFVISGYIVNPGDIDPYVDNDRVLLEGVGTTGYTFKIDGQYYQLENFEFTNDTNGDYPLICGSNADNSTLRNVKCLSTDYRSYYAINPRYMTYIRCIFDGFGAGAILSGCDYTYAIGCVFVGTNGSACASVGGYHWAFENCFFRGTSYGLSTGISVRYGGIIHNCVFVDCGISGLDLHNEHLWVNVSIYNNIFAHNAVYGIQAEAVISGKTSFAMFDFNCFYDNGTADLNSSFVDGYTYDPQSDVTLAPFTGADKAARIANFYETTSAVQGVGYPGVMNDDDYEGFADIGALQHEDSGTGGGGDTAYF